MLSYQIKKAHSSETTHPAIILLHGYGSNSSDLFSFANYLPIDHTIISLQAPMENPFGGYAWYSIQFNPDQNKWSDLDEARKSLNMIIKQLEYLKEQYNLNSNEITLMGFSQGAILSWSLLLDQPKKFRRAICMSGYINVELLKKPLETYQNILAYGSHGKSDATVPFDWAESSIRKLQANNPKVVFNYYPDGHNVSQENFRDILEWLSKTNPH